MLTISVWPRRLKEFLLTHPLYKSPRRNISNMEFGKPHATNKRKITSGDE